MGLRFQRVTPMVSHPLTTPDDLGGDTLGTATTQTRHNRTITVDFHDEATYVQLLGDGKALVEWVMAFILSIGLQLKHKACSPQK